MKTILVHVLAVALAGQLVAAQQADEAERQLRAAMNTAMVDGNLAAAIEQYKALSARYEKTNRRVAATALVRLAECYQKLGDAKAQSIYERLLREYADQPQAASIARERVASHSGVGSAEVTMRALPNSAVLPGNVTPDARYLTFTSWDDGQLYLRDLQSGVDRALTRRHDFNIGIPAISRDGTRVAYGVYQNGCENRSGALPALCLIALQVDGVSAPRTLATNDDVLEISPMDWSPDGRTIAVSLRRQDRTAQVGVVDAATGSLRVLQTLEWRGATRVFFSPDGKSLVFDLPANDVGDDRTIVMLALNGSHRVPLVEHASQNIPMGWTPDGSALLFASDRNGALALWAQPLGDRRPSGTPRLVRANLGGAWALGVTNNGSLYHAVRKYDRDITVGTLDLQAGRQVGPTIRPIRRFVGTNSVPQWSRDGRYLAYISQRGFDPTNNTGRIIGIHDMETGDEREVRPRLLYFGTIDWSPDARRFATSGTDTKGRNGIFTIDVATGEVTLVTEATIDAAPNWSPDGRRMYYRKGVIGNGSRTLVERDLVSGTERVLAQGPGQVAAIRVSPNGESIAFFAGEPNGESTVLMEVSTTSGAVRQLLKTADSQRLATFIAPVWTADSSGVLVRMRTPNELWLVPLSGGSVRRLDADVNGWSLGSVGQMSLHPDNRQIAFLTGSLSGEVLVLDNFLSRPQAVDR
jgi:Tol biopolymer transport system component